MKYSLILATTKNGAIGNKNDLVIHCKEDMKRFRSVTNGKAIIMGRKTYDSLPHFLPNRMHVIVTRNESLLNNNRHVREEFANGDFNSSPFIYVKTLEEACQVIEKYSNYFGWEYNDQEAVVIGGATMYNEAIESELVDTIYHTVFDYEVTEADTFVTASPLFTNDKNTETLNEVDCYVFEKDKTIKMNVNFVEYKRKWQSVT